MKFITAIVLTALLSFIAALYFPWWSMAIAAFIVGLLIHQKAPKAYAAGFLAIQLLWSGLAWWKNIPNEGILAARIGELFKIGDNPFLLITLTGFVGALVAGFAAMSGSFLRSEKK